VNCVAVCELCCSVWIVLQCVHCVAVCELCCSVCIVLQCVHCVSCVAVCELCCSVWTVLQCVSCVAVCELCCSVWIVLQCVNCGTPWLAEHFLIRSVDHQLQFAANPEALHPAQSQDCIPQQILKPCTQHKGRKVKNCCRSTLHVNWWAVVAHYK